MAKPDCDDGFVMISLELGAALAMARLTTAEQVVVWEVVSRTYGPAKLLTAAISATDLARRTGLDRAFVAKAIRSLVDSNIIAESKIKGEYKVQKNYDHWDRSGHKETPEASKARRDYARAAIKTARDAAKSGTQKCVNTDTEGCVNTDTVPDSECVNTDTIGVSILTQSCVNTDTPRLLEEFRVLEKQQQAATEIVENQADEPFHPPTLPMPGPVASKPNPITAINEDVARIEKWIRDSGTNPMPFECKVQALVLEYPADWVEAAIKDAVIKCDHPRGPMYLVRKMLRDWKDCGGPENDPIYAGKKPKLHGGPAAVPNAVPDYLKDSDQAVPAPARRVEKSA